MSYKQEYKNPDWKEYTCEDCGDKFYTRFQDYNKCGSCILPILHKIEQKLKGVKSDEVEIDIDELKKRRKQKQKNNNTADKPKGKNKYFN